MPCTARAAISWPTWPTRAGDRGDGEDRHADQEDAPPAEAVAQRAADQQQRGEEERIRLDDPLRLGRRGVEFALDRRQRDVDDRAVDERHARAEDRGHQHPAPARGPRTASPVRRPDGGVIAGRLADLGHGVFEGETATADSGRSVADEYAGRRPSRGSRPTARGRLSPDSGGRRRRPSFGMPPGDPVSPSRARHPQRRSSLRC